MFSDKRLYHNLLSDWLLAIGLAAFAFLVLRSLLAVVRRKAAVPEKDAAAFLNALFFELASQVSTTVLVILALSFGARWLTLPESADAVVEKATVLTLLFQCALLAARGIRFWVRRYRSQKLAADAEAVTTLSSVGFVLQILVWVIAVLIALDHLGVNVTTLVASLGIGGIAVALAVQNILGDLFASFSIVFDKPFVIGDFIVVDTLMGTVEQIGLKTTRVRSLSGELLIFSNMDLLRSRIKNYKQMHQRRIVFSIGVSYGTPLEKIEALPQMLKEIVCAHNPVRFERAHFKGFSAYSLDFEVVYWIDSPDYVLYMDIQQAINLEIFRRFSKEGIAFAYPTQTLYLKKSSPSS